MCGASVMLSIVVDCLQNNTSRPMSKCVSGARISMDLRYGLDRQRRYQHRLRLSTFCRSSGKQEAHQLVGQAKRRATLFRPKAVGGGILDRLLEVLWGLVIPTNRVKFGDLSYQPSHHPHLGKGGSDNN